MNVAINQIHTSHCIIRNINAAIQREEQQSENSQAHHPLTSWHQDQNQLDWSTLSAHTRNVTPAFHSITAGEPLTRVYSCLSC